MSRILLLGSDGQLGHDVMEVFSSDPAHTVVPLTKIEIDFEADVYIRSELEKYLPFDYLINCAAATDTNWCELNINKAYTVNAFSVYEMACFCNKHNIPMFQISTDFIFDGKKKSAYKESDRAAPLNIYGASKLTGEELLSAYHEKYYIFRVASLFGQVGTEGSGKNFLETMRTLSNEQDNLDIVSDIIMTPTHTYDVAKAIKYFIDNGIKEYGIYNCTSKGECSWYDLTKKMFELLEINCNLNPVSNEDFPSKFKRPTRSSLCHLKMSKYFSMPEWEEALREYLDRKGRQ